MNKSVPQVSKVLTFGKVSQKIKKSEVRGIRPVLDKVQIKAAFFLGNVPYSSLNAHLLKVPSPPLQSPNPYSSIGLTHILTDSSFHQSSPYPGEYSSHTAQAADVHEEIPGSLQVHADATEM